jgi:hypothetical protein
MEEEMRLRGLADHTVQIYTQIVQRFAKFHRRPPEEMAAGEIRAFLLRLTEERKLNWSTINQSICALRFFYREVLQRPWEVEKLHLQRTRKKLPTVKSVLDTGGITRGVAVAGTMVAAADGTAGVHFINASDPTSAVTVGLQPTGGNAWDALFAAGALPAQ